MIRVLTTALAALIATLVFGIAVIVVTWLGGDRAGYRHAGIQRAWARAVLRGAGVRVENENEDLLAEARSRVLVANHSSLFDILVLASVLRVPYSWVMKEELGRIFFFGSAVRSAGHIMLDRSNTEKAVRSLDRMTERLATEPLTVIMFPEGTRSRTGALGRFRRGAFMLAIRAEAEILPAAIRGTFEIKPKGVGRIAPGTVSIRIGEPIPTAGLEAKDRGRITTRVREEVAALLVAPDRS